MRAASCETIVLSQQEAAGDIMKMRVSWTDPEHVPHAGQFFMLRGWADDEAPFLSRPISLHSYDPEQESLEFLYQVKGQGTEKLSALEPGSVIRVTGPMGNGFDAGTLAEQYERIAVVGGGIGTAPLYQLCRELAQAGRKPDLFCGFREEVYEMEPYRELCGLVKVSTDTGAVGFHGFVTQLFDPADYDIVLVCGPDVMMKNVAAACRRANTKCLVSLEKKMACGIGACLGCTCRTAQGVRSVCKEGPVFDAQEIYGGEVQA